LLFIVVHCMFLTPLGFIAFGFTYINL